MKRPLAAFALCLLVLAPFAARAQDVAPTPIAHPETYDDLAMHFTAPKPFRGYMQRPAFKLAELPDDPTLMAEWIAGDENRPKTIFLVQQHFIGHLDGWIQQFSQELRDQGGEGAIIRNKENVSLKNGMPAYWMEMASGTGFESKKAYVLIWVDGQRGCALSFVAQTGESDTQKAKAILLSDVSAVRYPTDRDNPST